MEVKLEKIYYENKQYLVLENIYMKCKKKSVTTILGSSGSGKTSLLEVIAGIKSPVKGDVCYDNKKISLIKDLEIKNYIGFMPAYIEGVFSFETVEEELSSRLLENTFSNKTDRIKEILELVGFPDTILNKKIKHLKNAEQKMLIFACSIIHNPEIVFLDEPTVGMNIEMQRRFVKIVSFLKRKEQKTIIVATKDSDFALHISDFVYLLKDGKIKGEGGKYEVLSNTSLLQNVKIPVPKTIHFSKRVLKEKGVKIGYRDEINDLIKDIFRFVP